jgi:protein-S-isoprenylcysteine O-methyltransferase Ste14
VKDKILPPTYLLIAVLTMIGLHLFLPLGRLIPVPWNLVGLVPLLLGIVINVYADKALHLVGTTVKPFLESTALVTQGVYRLSRHPMYLGFVLILVGVAILLGSLSPWLVVPIFILLMEVVFLRVEERMLGEKFGEDWLAYKKKVHRWI